MSIVAGVGVNGTDQTSIMAEVGLGGTHQLSIV